MNCQRPSNAWKWQVLYSFFLCSWGWVSGQLHFSVPEESETGTLVGNIAHDLGIDLTKSNKQRLRLGSGGGSKFFAVDHLSGDLTVNGRIDRESLCGSNSNCLLHLELVTENPLGFYSIEIEIVDINDNSPIFSNPDQIINITELVTSPGVQFSLQIAQDPDVGINSVSQYRISPNPHFSLSVTNRKDGTLIAELILEKVLDREEKGQHILILTALDGGEPKRSGSTQVTIIVLDINDNPPVFDQPRYKIGLQENTPLKSVIIKLNATDLDDGPNAEIIYLFDDHTLDSAKKIFELNSHTGEIYIAGILDFEESHYYELSVRARDRGILTMEGRCLIQVDVEDVNDNTPEIYFTSVANEVPENAAIGTVLGFMTVIDKDSGSNGEIVIEVSPNVLFKCQPFNNRYSLITNGYLDRERVSSYNIVLKVSDLGSPPLHNQTSLSLRISDVNDNYPIFLQSVYKASIKENNEPGTLLFTISASDQDEGDNAKLKYSIAESLIDGSSISSFVYINSENGNIYTQRSFDYEQYQVLQFNARAEDFGSPVLFSNVSIFLFILDTNDNHPTVLYPENAGEFIPQEKILMSASAGYLVTKVSAVDLDSGHNAWLAYSLLESSSPTLFQISEYTGEIRTIRGLYDAENREHRLLISVRDHGQPPLSTTFTVIVNIVESVLQDIPKSSDFLSHPKPSSDLTLYLIISLVAISLVSLVTFIILLVRCLRKDTDSSSCGSCPLSKSHSQTYSDQYKPTLYLNSDGTLKYMEVRMVPADAEVQCYPTCFPPNNGQNNMTARNALHFPHVTNVSKETDSPSDSSWLNDPNQVRFSIFFWYFDKAIQ